MAKKVDGFQDIPQPELSPNETARAMSGAPSEIIGPVAIPEEYRGITAPVQRHPMIGVTEHRPIAEIVDAFLADIHAHPDAHLLTTTLAGPADEAEGQAFPDAPVRSLRVDQIRLIRRTSGELISGEPKSRKAWQQQIMDDNAKVWEEQRAAAIASGARPRREEYAR